MVLQRVTLSPCLCHEPFRERQRFESSAPSQLTPRLQVRQDILRRTDLEFHGRLDVELGNGAVFHHHGETLAPGAQAESGTVQFQSQGRVYVPLPSASINTLSPAPALAPQASITNMSFTAIQAMVSTPFALMASALSMNPGRCSFEQVGVNAPGTENTTTFLPLNNSSVLTEPGPSALIT